MHDTILITWNCHEIYHATICKDKFFLRKKIMNSQKTNFRKTKHAQKFTKYRHIASIIY